MRVPPPGQGANVWVVDGNHSMWDALTWVDQLMGNVSTKVFNLDDLVKVCQHWTIENSKTVDFLAVFGHGTGGYQSVGAGRSLEHSGTKSLWWKSIALTGESQLRGPAEQKIRALDGVLSDGATIFLAGCNVGEGDYGTGLLTTVSAILGNRTVQAFENKVFWWSGLLVGSLKEASGASVDSSYSVYSL
jgi:hypothetical protein